MIQEFADAVVKKIRNDMNNYADDIASGNAKDYEEYRFMCGRLRGLAAAEEYINDLAKTVKESEE